MSDGDIQEGDEAKTGSKKGLMFGLVAAFVLGGAGFYATYSGLIGQKSESTESAHKPDGTEKGAGDGQSLSPDIAFVTFEPLVISLSGSSESRYLRFGAQLEVVPAFKEEVTQLLPRVLDVLNEYLRAVDSRDLEDPATFGRMRAQMLRRIKMVTGKGRVRNLLITEFVLN